MTKLYDVKGAICEHSPQCEHICHFVDAEPEPRTVNLDEVEPVSDMWQAIAGIAVGFVLFGVALLAAVLFATGAWVWSLLI
jgi:hypothetical protein